MKKNIYIVGDSTASDKAQEVYPETGWGQALRGLLGDDYEVINHAKNGRSSKSFYDKGLFEFADGCLKHSDLLLISFGHNDQKEDEARKTIASTSYKEYLMKYIEAARHEGAIPILVTSVIRRHFSEGSLKSEKEIHGDYPSAVREMACDEKVLLIDLCEKSHRYVSQLGEDQSQVLYLILAPGEHENYPTGIKDNTHLSEKGAAIFGEMVAEGIKQVNK